jgi:hypothetical protein
MNIAEILRKMADVIDSNNIDQSSTEITNRPQQTDVEVDQPTDTAGIERQAQVNVKTMVPPLQQKLDLMKRLAGEETCDTCGAIPCGCEQGQDELAIMKQNAGIRPAVIAIADEDEPFEG